MPRAKSQMIDSATNVNTHRMIAAADQRLASASGSSLAAAAVAAAAHAAHAAHSASNAASTASGTTPDGTTMATQKNPFAIQELLGLTSHGDQIKRTGASTNSNNPGGGGGDISSSAGGNNPVSGMGANFPPISCYNSSFFNSSALTENYNQHQRMQYFNSAASHAIFGNLHHQSQSFANASSAAAASHLLDSTLRSDHSLSSKQDFYFFIFHSV